MSRVTMMAVITPSDAFDDWRFSPDELCANIKRKWPGATILRLGNPGVSYRHRWILVLSNPDYPLSGHPGNHDKALVFDGRIPDCAEFALWIRSIIPSHVELLMWDDKCEAPLPLTAGTTAEAILGYFGNMT